MYQDGIDKTKTLLGGIAAISLVMYFAVRAMKCETMATAVPPGWRYASPVPDDVTARCVALLSQEYGYGEYFTSSNGTQYFLRVENHYDVKRGNHKGVTAYQK